jgi:hypothetical protein
MSRSALVIIAVVVAGVAGVMVGRHLSSQRMVEQVHDAATTWQTGDAFPDVNLVSEWGEATSTMSLLADGGVALFLDLECPPCIEMAGTWTDAIRSGSVAADRVVAITGNPDVAVQRFREQYSPAFGIYRDVEQAFYANGWITAYPVEVMVGDGATVLAVNEDASRPIDDAMLQSAIAGGR